MAGGHRRPAALGSLLRLGGPLDAVRQYRRFLRHLQRAVAIHDRKQIAATVGHPLHTHVAARRPQRSLDAISARSLARRFASSQRAMSGSGELWLSATCAAGDCTAPPVMIMALKPQPAATR